MKETELATYYKLTVDDLMEARQHMLGEMEILEKDAAEAREQKF